MHYGSQGSSSRGIGGSGIVTPQVWHAACGGTAGSSADNCRGGAMTVADITVQKDTGLPEERDMRDVLLDRHERDPAVRDLPAPRPAIGGDRAQFRIDNGERRIIRDDADHFIGPGRTGAGESQRFPLPCAHLSICGTATSWREFRNRRWDWTARSNSQAGKWRRPRRHGSGIDELRGALSSLEVALLPPKYDTRRVAGPAGLSADNGRGGAMTATDITVQEDPPEERDIRDALLDRHKRDPAVRDLAAPRVPIGGDRAHFPLNHSKRRISHDGADRLIDRPARMPGKSQCLAPAVGPRFNLRNGHVLGRV